MTACPIRYQRQVPDRKGKIFYTSITSLSHISKTSRLESIIPEMLDKGKIIFLTGNPGDGKTFIIKALDGVIKHHNAFVETECKQSECI